MGSQHGFIYWIIIGLLAGGLAKMITPGTDREPKGCITTMLLGIGGSILVGYIMRHFLGGGSGNFVATLIGATIGAVSLIWAARKFWK